MRKAFIVVGYAAWFLVLVRILFLSTGNPYTNLGEVLGSHAGLAFWLLILTLIPFFIARALAKKNGTPISWPYVMGGTTLIALMLSVGGFYVRLHSAAMPQQAEANLQPPSEAAAQTIQAVAKPSNEQECIDNYAVASPTVQNVELLREFCHSAFNANRHPIARARDLCKVVAWKTNLNRDAMEIYQECDAKNPLPVCPSNMTFDLNNMRCEVVCDGLHGYAPDPSGRSCYLACPNGGWPIYSGTVRACDTPR